MSDLEVDLSTCGYLGLHHVQEQLRPWDCLSNSPPLLADERNPFIETLLARMASLQGCEEENITFLSSQKEKHMKLPQPIEGIHREGRTDCLVSAGVEPAFLGDVWKKVKEIGGKVLPVIKPVACAACPFLPHPAAQIACLAACSL